MHSFSFVTVLSLSSPGVVFHALHTGLAATTRGTVASVLVPLRYRDYMSATRQPPRVTRSRSREVGAPQSVLYVTFTWMSAAHTTGPGPASTAQTLASVDKDKPQPSPT